MSLIFLLSMADDDNDEEDDDNEQDDDNEDEQGHTMENAVTVNENTNNFFENSVEDVD